MTSFAPLKINRLSNGIPAYCLPKQEIPLACVLIHFGIGSGCETTYQTGMCHFLEHMMFKGSDKFPQGSIDIFSMRKGGENNAFTSRDSTCYYHVLPWDKWHSVLEIERDRLQSLNLNKKDFESEKQVVLEELYMYQDDPFEALYDAHYLAAFPASHPYNHPVLGFEQILKNMTVEHMRDFYNSRYQAGNMKFLVLGRVEPDFAFEELEKFFGKFPVEDGFKYDQIEFNRSDFDPFIRIPQDVNQTRLRLSFPSSRAGDVLEEPAAAVIEEILAGGRSCPLVHKLRDELGLITSMNVFNDDHALDGLFFIDLELNDGVEPNQVLPYVHEELSRLRTDLVGEDELKSAQMRSSLCYYQDQERLEDRAYCLSQHLLEDDFDSYFEFDERVKNVDSAQVQQFALKYFDPKLMITGVSYDQSLSAPKLMEAKF